MNFFDAIKTCCVKYVDFSGRAARSEFWYFVLFILVAEICLSAVSVRLWLAFVLAMILPRFAVAARRLHDTGRAAWWLLLVLIPVIGWIVLLVWFSQRSEEHDNTFGPPPLPGIAQAASATN